MSYELPKTSIFSHNFAEHVSVIYLSWHFCILNPQSRLSPCFNFSVSILVLLCPDTALISLQVNLTPQPSM